jgi:hypothetical protein
VILTAAPGTSICSIDDEEEMIIDPGDIPTSQSMIDHYLESPTVSQKTHFYHACIYINCMKPLFIIMKNKGFMEWLKKQKNFIEENDLETMLQV